MTLRLVIFVWDDINGECYDCSRPAAFFLEGMRDYQVCAICAANHAADGNLIRRIVEE